ncbi:hypothetical protein WMF18_23375 [Sorangium sp. So ce315]|uniref:hypothetical protein n=1 Tax=Sorangium sp. So ce315 TaxID=3133299 RepID=UPI003F6462C2
MPAQNGGLVCDRSEGGGAAAAVVAWPFGSRAPAATPMSLAITLSCCVALEGAAPASTVIAQAASLRDSLPPSGPPATALERAENRRIDSPVAIVADIFPPRPAVRDGLMINGGVAAFMQPNRANRYLWSDSVGVLLHVLGRRAVVLIPSRALQNGGGSMRVDSLPPGMAGLAAGIGMMAAPGQGRVLVEALDEEEAVADFARALGRSN